MFSRLLPLSLGHQNIPDRSIIPCYPRNIKFPTQNPADSRPMCPTEHSHLITTSGIVYIYLLLRPTPTQHPHYTPPPFHPAPSACQSPYPLIQRTQLVSLSLTNHSTMARPCFSLFFGW